MGSLLERCRAELDRLHERLMEYDIHNHIRTSCPTAALLAEIDEAIVNEQARIPPDQEIPDGIPY